MPLKDHVAALEALIASTPFVTAASIPHMFLMEVRSQRSEVSVPAGNLVNFESRILKKRRSELFATR